MQNAETHNDDLVNILRNLQNICETNLSHPVNTSEGQLHPPALDDLLIELRSRKSIKHDENDFNCYRCKHFLRVPQNLLQGEYDCVSNSLGEYGANVTFVQAIVWLKSAIASMTEIPAEQFHLIFHKRWSIDNNAINGTQQCERRNAEGRYSRNYAQYIVTENEQLNSKVQESSNEIITRERDQRRDLRNLGGGSTSATSPNLLYNTSHNRKSNKSLGCHLPNSTKEEVACRVKSIELLSPQSDINESNNCLAENIIISESDEECSSCSDMFADTPEKQLIKETFHTQTEDDLIEEEGNSVQSQYMQRRCLSELNNVTPDYINQEYNNISMDSDTPSTKNYISVDGDESYSTSDVSMLTDKLSCKRCHGRFLENSNSQEALELASPTIVKSNYSQDLKLCSDNPCSINSEITDETSIARGKEVVDKTVNKEDSAYETYTYNIDDTDKRMISRREKEGLRNVSIGRQMTQVILPKLGSHVGFDKNTGNIQYLHKKGESCPTTTTFKKYVHNEKRTSNANTTKRKISSEWLHFMLDTLNTDDIVFQSINVILSSFEDDIISKRYLKRRCWKDTLEYEAVNAVLNFCDIIEAEKKTNELLEEIIERITKLVEKVIEDNELSKITLRMYHLTLLLEFCNSMRICIKVIDLIMMKLMFHGNRITSVINEKQTDIHFLAEQLYLLLYALSICLKKYRLIFSGKEKHKIEESIVTAVVDLWKKRFDNCDITAMGESIDEREQRWMTILDDFTIKTSEYFIQFAEKSLSLLNLFRS